MLSVFCQARLVETGQGKPSDLLLMVAGYTVVSMVFVIHLLVRFSGVPSSHVGKRKGERA